MKFRLMVRARPRAAETIQHKHAEFLSGIQSLPLPWCPASDRWPLPKEARPGEIVSVNLSRAFGNGMKVTARYASRAYLPDEANGDDFVCVEFNSDRVNYPDAIQNAFPVFIKAFGAYVARVSHQEFISFDFERWRASGINDRHGVFRFFPVHFLDRKLCEKALGLTPKQVVRAVENDVERASLRSGGVLVVVTSKTLSFEEAQEVDARLRRLLAPGGRGR